MSNFKNSKNFFENQRFRLTDIHVKLLRRAYVSWCDDEFGAPSFDPKRPYGNSDVLMDVHEIVTGEQLEDELSEELEKEYDALHKEMKVALQVVLSSGSFTPGWYEASRYGNDWKLIKSEAKPTIR